MYIATKSFVSHFLKLSVPLVSKRAIGYANIRVDARLYAQRHVRDFPAIR